VPPQFQDPPLLRREEVAAVLEAAIDGRVAERDPNGVVIALGLHEDDRLFAEQWCLRVGREAPDPRLRTSAALAVGHLARRFGIVGDGARQLVSDVSNDPLSDARAQDAVDDVRQFAG
jgi:hypothetical protein